MRLSGNNDTKINRSYTKTLALKYYVQSSESVKHPSIKRFRVVIIIIIVTFLTFSLREV